MTDKRRRILIAGLAAGLAGAVPALAARPGMPGAGARLNGFDLSNASIPLEEIERGGPPRDGIPAIDAPRFVAAAQASFLRPESRVLGIALGGVAKAYPIAILNWHEIVNDRIGDQPLLVTFCPLCGTGMAFRPQARGRTLRFGVSGLLHNSDLLLYDRETESLWSQLIGTAITGTLRGERLPALAASHTTWREWRNRHPATLVLSQETGHLRDYGRDPYAGYEKSEQLLFSVRNSSARYHPKEQVLGIELGALRKAYPFAELQRARLPLRDRIGDQDVTVEFDAENRTGRVLDAAGRELPSVISFWFAWYAFHPQTQVFTAP